MKHLSLVFLMLCMAGPSAAADLIKLNSRHSKLLIKTLRGQSSPELKAIKQLQGHARYQQLINNIPIYGYHVIQHDKGKASFYTGHWIKTLYSERVSLKANPQRFNADEALAIAKQHFQGHDTQIIPALQFRQESSKLHYILNNSKRLQLVYVVSFFADSQEGGHPTRPYYIIDAIDHSILRHWDGLTTNQIGTGPGGNEKIGRYEYGIDYPKLDVTNTEGSNTCAMVNEHVVTLNLDHAVEGGKLFEFQCPYHTNDDEINGAYSALNDAHFFGSVIFSMYTDWYHITPLTSKLKMRVHYGYDYGNAFWDGSSMTFGDGNGNFYPFASALDVTAHEISHGLTEQNSGLEYSDQSGGLNESFSDMAGKTAEFYLYGKNKWTIGENITKSNHPLRYMDKPERDGPSIGDARDFAPGLDVHYSSGVFNRLFYVLATMPGWDTRKAFDIMLKANLEYWEPESTFIEAAEGIIHAAQDLHYNVENTVDAAKAVGITCVKLSGEYSCALSPENF